MRNLSIEEIVAEMLRENDKHADEPVFNIISIRGAETCIKCNLRGLICFVNLVENDEKANLKHIAKDFVSVSELYKQIQNFNIESAIDVINILKVVRCIDYNLWQNTQDYLESAISNIPNFPKVLADGRNLASLQAVLKHCQVIPATLPYVNVKRKVMSPNDKYEMGSWFGLNYSDIESRKTAIKALYDWKTSSKYWLDNEVEDIYLEETLLKKLIYIS